MNPNNNIEQQQTQDINTLIKARYPIIWIVTQEETRAIRRNIKSIIRVN